MPKIFWHCSPRLERKIVLLYTQHLISTFAEGMYSKSIWLTSWNTAFRRPFCCCFFWITLPRLWDYLKHQYHWVCTYILNTDHFCCCLQYDVLEMDQFTHKLEPFPLLTSHTDYFPDTQDLTLDTDAREYWLRCFEDALDKVTETNLYLLRKHLKHGQDCF